jgi:hypothetical protein
MISRKMKLLSIAVGAAALVATPALASTVHQKAASTGRVVGRLGRVRAG